MYTYAGNDPINSDDPSGLLSIIAKGMPNTMAPGMTGGGGGAAPIMCDGSGIGVAIGVVVGIWTGVTSGNLGNTTTTCQDDWNAAMNVCNSMAPGAAQNKCWANANAAYADCVKSYNNQ